MRRQAILVAVIGVLMILTGSLSFFVDSFAKDVNSSQENADVINARYETFKNLMESFNGDREVLYTNVINEMYIEDMQIKYPNWYGVYMSYEDTVVKVKEYEDFLKERCVGILYNDSNTQSKCDSMVISFETAMNYYVKDVEKFNEFIDLYNDGLEDESNRVEHYDIKDYQYIDFDDDGKYLGK